MTPLARFLVYNMLLSLAAGLVAWLIVMAALRLLRIQSSAQSLYLLSLPVFKSFLILLGVGLVFPWPAQLFEGWHRQAIPFRQVLPFLLIWAVIVYLAYQLLVRRARQALLKDALPATQTAPHLAAIFNSVQAAYQHVPCPTCDDDLCCVVQLNRSVALLVSERLDSPVALTDAGQPALLFPAGLIPLLRDDELAAALAHELAHFILRRPNWCSAGTLQKLTLLNPLTGLMSHYLHRQEEKACDDLAIKAIAAIEPVTGEAALPATGQPELYAEMLTKCYRYASQQKEPVTLGGWQPLPRLLGFRPLLSERVEHILAVGDASGEQKHSPVVFWLVWAALFGLLFFSWSF